ncbi:hypothetical protein H0H87_007814, partial [Tephrocybe sp. NHM501043]
MSISTLTPILRLPREVLEEIADSVDLKTRLSLCRASRVWHWCTTPSIYRDVCLTSPSKAVGCCRAVIVRRIAAISMRRLTIRYTPPIRPVAHYFAPFYALVRRALSCTSHLQELILQVPDPHYASLLRQATFHSLSRFECNLALTEALILFLNRHPTIVYLQIAPSAHSPHASALGEGLPRVSLPKLQYFIGDGEYVPAVVPNASLRAAFLVWDTVDSTPREAIKSLEASSGATINLVSCRRGGWNLDLIDLISTWLPDIYVLIITNVLDSESAPSD